MLPHLNPPYFLYKATHTDKGLSSPQKVGRVSFGVGVVVFDKFFAGFFKFTFTSHNFAIISQQ